MSFSVDTLAGHQRALNNFSSPIVGIHWTYPIHLKLTFLNLLLINVIPNCSMIFPSFTIHFSHYISDKNNINVKYA